MARPTKLSATRTKAICESVSRGTPEEAAARAADIHPATLYRWKERGEAALDAETRGGKLTDQDRLAARFCEDLEKARGECERNLVTVVSHSALGHPAEFDKHGRKVREERKPNPTMAVILLERKWPQRWGRRLHVRDDTPRTPAPIRQPSVASFAAAFAASFGDELPDVDPANLMPSIAGDVDDEQAPGNGRRNGSGS